MRETCPNSEFYFVFLYGKKEEILNRLKKREGHFMKANMMESQFDDLELPQDDEKNCCIVAIDNKSYQEIDNEVKAKISVLLSRA